MKKIICVGLILCSVLGLGSCGFLGDTQDSLGALGSDITLNLSDDKLQDWFNQGLSGLEGILGTNCIEATGEAKNAEAGKLYVYDDKIVITVDTKDIRDKMDESGVTAKSIEAERLHAEIAQMEYKLQYQYVVSLRINEKNKSAVCSAIVTEDTMKNTVDITIPVTKEEMSVTIYELLQGGPIKVEGCLQHGTATTKSITKTYYLNSIPDGKDGNVLAMQDHRSK